MMRSHAPAPAMHREGNGHALHAPVLVLNASYEPINVCAARLAIRVPSVIRLLEYRRIPHQTRALSRKNILLRDRNTCQYCGEVLPSSELTLDHVVPRSRGGASTWENLVACCFACNNKKGDRTPQEAGMVLARQPRQISIHAKHKLLAGDSHTWDKYLFA